MTVIFKKAKRRFTYFFLLLLTALVSTVLGNKKSDTEYTLDNSDYISLIPPVAHADFADPGVIDPGAGGGDDGGDCGGDSGS